MSFVFKKVLIISDHQFLLENIFRILSKKKLTDLINFDAACSPQTNINTNKVPCIKRINIREEKDSLINSYDLIISAHCKQIFPSELTSKIKCINIHPGFNPYNRGWYPHVFSLINKLPAGATIHEMDSQIDHGPIIIQREVDVKSFDTSESLYKKVIQQEIFIFSEIIENVLLNKYETHLPKSEGNINYKRDYEKLKTIYLNKIYNAKELIDLLRALSHGNYNNAFFIDKEQNKIYVKIHLEKGNEQ